VEFRWHRITANNGKSTMNSDHVCIKPGAYYILPFGCWAHGI